MPEENPRNKSSLIPTLVTVIVIALVAGGGYYAWKTFMQSAPEPEPTPVVETPPVPQTSQYASSTMRFSLSYPIDFTLQEPYAYTRVSASKPINGVKFAVPLALTQGTNLAPDSGISVEQLPRASRCSADIYLLANVRATSMTEGATTYSVATSSETKEGETYDEVVYAYPSSSPCIAVRYFMHTTAASTSTTPFNRALVLAAFEEIRRSVVVQPAAAN